MILENKQLVSSMVEKSELHYYRNIDRKRARMKVGDEQRTRLRHRVSDSNTSESRVITGASSISFPRP